MWLAVVRHGKPLVCGVTGLNESQLAHLVAVSDKVPLVFDRNMSQGVTVLNQLIEQVGPDRLLYGTDWPFYHLAATLAKVLLVTRDRTDIRDAILRGNALRLLGLASDTL